MGCQWIGEALESLQGDEASQEDSREDCASVLMPDWQAATAHSPNSPGPWKEVNVREAELCELGAGLPV